MPKISLFPRQFLTEDACFGLFSVGSGGQIDLPITIEADAGLPIHIVHSDPDHLAYLVGLVVLQAWVTGIDELGVPPNERRPVLVVTDRPGRFGEAYLRLHVPINGIKSLFKKRRVTIHEKGKRGQSEVPATSSFLDLRLERDDTRTRLHNFFPAFQVFGASGAHRILEGREYLGRDDSAGPGVLITRRMDKDKLRALQDQYKPLLAVFDAHGVAVTSDDLETPSIFYHESIFSRDLVSPEHEQVVLYCLPDARFERFCSQASLCIIEPQEPHNLTLSWKRADGAIQALIERMDQRADRVIVEVYRSATRLRNVLLSLPVGVQCYEQALITSGQPESLWYDWSITQPLLALESRLPEMAALGQWEELILQELVQALRELSAILLQQDSPKREPLLSSIRDSLARSRRVALVVSGPTIASGLQWVIRVPEPYGLGLPPDKVRAVTFADIKTLSEDEDCIIHQVFDPHEVFSGLARVGARQIIFILLRNELRFTGERFLRTRFLFPRHPANESILRPVYDKLERIEPVLLPSSRDRKTTLFSDSDFEMVLRMFNQGPRTVEHGMVLVEDAENAEGLLKAEAEAYLVRLEASSAVFLDATSQVSYVSEDEAIRTGPVEFLEPGHRLIIINPQARESIAHRILTSKKEVETDQSAGQMIKQWQDALCEGIKRSGLTHREVLQRIQGLGSRRVTPLVVGQWAKGDVLGPLDAQDILRIGQVVQSDWLMQNWQRVGFALLIVRSGHRLLGRQITRIIQKAAVGDYELGRKDEQFLAQLGITMGELQDAVDLLTVEAVSREKKLVPIDQLGKVISL
ncbi:MAG: hypothetical protein OJF50_000313 [Nitrospira sp.]|nr:hypothetical protein [Nitrospira sp.]